ncbi:alcohol dehydrogenase zinc-binding domain-containing protein [Nannizzia gypsea CBS 118893]|uniref:Alcohol dehydrogenase zinc-binding domain-containing protein n=1 Tax=Arthroderma gypseum (strain ATCC MYA-4604 / CBS 118893) TaxID=535722 RepID=E4V1A0_ARTGP|nr:alcohol dehydrogenase zinc-binding domain-containing protein [Nannizzia gypsea CBS 118893]EFR03815.1 alcohol dehydrogenase zinc-binding domain-containing protein [Nannizzia gypsea CBS 118893]
MASGTSVPQTGRSVNQDVPSTTLTLQTRPTPIPNFEVGEHLIRVHATALCAGELYWHTYVTFTKDETVPGPDVAGTVVLAPPSSPFQPGDHVYCRIPYSRPGGARDHTIALTSELARKPKNLSWEEAATVPLSALTAWQALFDQSGMWDGPEDERVKGKRVAVTAASGAVGMWILQFARIAGFEAVIGTCGDGNEEFVKSMGATDAVNYKKTSLMEWAAEKEGRKADMVIDCFGGKSLVDAWGCVKDGGVLVSMVGYPEQEKPAGLEVKDVKSHFFIMEPRGDQLQKVSELVEQGKCSFLMDSVYPLEQFQEATDKVESRRVRGKVVLKVV